MYAIVEISGKQYKVRENDRLYVPRLQDAPDSKISFDRVLLVSNDKSVSVGTPVVEGASVEATVLDHVKADKVLVFKKKRRKRYKVKRGHRQPYTQILVDKLALDGSGKKKAAPKKAEAPKAEAPKAEAPKAEAPKAAAPKTEAPKTEAPKTEAPKTEAPKAEAPKAAAPKAASKGKAKGDDLTKIEGIGPKTAKVFGEAGIDSYQKLADASVEQLNGILAEAGPSLARLTPDTWPEQAALAAAGDWDALDKLQKELDGGRRS